MTHHTRNCPTDGVALVEETMAAQLVERCPDCAGLFFDKGELESILRIARHFQAVRLDEPELETIPAEEVERHVMCPADGTHMNPRELGGTIIDECPQCEGLWLDHGEVVALKIAEASIRQNLSLYLRLGS